MEITNEQLKNIYSCSTQIDRTRYLRYINKYAKQFGIDNTVRMSAFLAQIGYESSQLKNIQENINYNDDVLEDTFYKDFESLRIKKSLVEPTTLYTLTKSRANRIYANKMGNGDEESGDGWKYRGRGLIRIIGKNSYSQMTKDLAEDFITDPNLLLFPKYTVLSAFWYWETNELNRYSTLNEEDFKTLTRQISGNLNGYGVRFNLWTRAKKVLIYDKN